MLFLAEKKIIAHQLRDFPEWHQGTHHYGFWGLMIDDPAWQETVALAQAHMARFLHPGYRRQPHVTLFCGGLLADDFFSEEILARQVQALAEARLPPFCLELSGCLDSFATAPHLPLADPDGGLAKIRAVLATVNREDAPPASYHPHITLGFYRQSFATRAVAAHLRAFRPLPPPPFSARSIHFCRFATADSQGPLETLACLDLPAATR